MITTSSKKNANHRIVLASLLVVGTLVGLSLTGCGGSEEDADLDPISLLQHYKKETPRHHPVDLVEIDLGDYKVTIPVVDSVDVYRVNFQAFLIVPVEKKQELTDRFNEYKTRVRDLVLMAAKKMNSEKNSDPHQAWLKSEILDSVSKLLKTRDIRDVVFAKFNFDRS